MTYTTIIYWFQILFCKNSVPYSITFTRCLGSSSAGYQRSRLGRTVPLSGWARCLSRAWWVNKEGDAMLFRCQKLVSKLHISRLQILAIKLSALNEYFKASFHFKYFFWKPQNLMTWSTINQNLILLIINNLNYISEPIFCSQIIRNCSYKLLIC